MNNFAAVTIASWETRNWRHREKALVLCKNYGLQPVTRYIFIGELYAKERRELEKKFKDIFTSKTEKCLVATMCKSCFNESVSGLPIKKRIGAVVPYELIQFPENG